MRRSRDDRSRARTDEEKEEVREAFIKAGRRLFARESLEQVFLRQIAQEAGYAPATVYRYFSDQRSLLICIRERDMSAALEEFKKLAGTSDDARERVLTVFTGVTRYWLENFDNYQILFGLSFNRPPIIGSEGVPFGQSSFARNSLLFYRSVVSQYLEHVGSKVDPRFATDCLIASTHGMIAFPKQTATLDWSPTDRMIHETICSLLDKWARRSS